MNRQVNSRVTIFLTMTLVIVVPTFAQIPDGVSPGASDRTAEIEGRCPTFIWNSIPGAAFHELVGYQLSKDSDTADPAGIDLAKADQVLYAKVAGSAPAWEPELAECLNPGGNYVWFVRAVYLEEEGEVAEASEWSYGRYFSISSTPSAREVEEAMRVLRRYAGNTVDPEGLETERADTKQPTPSRLVAIQKQTQKSVTSAKTAIKATVPDATGETYGVVGISNSPNGAGMAAGNTGGGADLVLDGLEDGDLDTVFTQAGIDRTSSDEEWFSLINSGAGVLSLNVEGQIVADGSGLTAVDADTLDGTDGSDFVTDTELAAFDFVDVTELAAFDFVDATELAAFDFVDATELAAADFATNVELAAHAASALHDDTNAATICPSGYYLNGSGTCVLADGSGSCGTGSVCAGGHGHPATEITAGSMDIGANNYSHSSKTGYYYVGGGAFNVKSNNTPFYQNLDYLRPNDGAGSDVSGTAPIDLPDGAVITGVTGYYYDNGTTAPNPTWFCNVQRRTVGSTTVTGTAWATITINWVNSDSTVREVDGPTVNILVNKTAYSYYLVAGINNTNGSPDFRHYGCRVAYRYTNTNN